MSEMNLKNLQTIDIFIKNDGAVLKLRIHFQRTDNDQKLWRSGLYLMLLLFDCFYFSFCGSDHMENICGYLMKYTNLVTGWQYR